MNPHPVQGSTGERTRNVSGVHQVYVRCMSCMCQVYVRCIPGDCQMCQMYVRCMSGVCQMCRICQAYVRCMSGVYMLGACQVYVRCMSGVCQVCQVSHHRQPLHTPTCSRGVMLQFQLISMQTLQ